jgi:pimeloyl-ACP methyl ester carboxylesterase
MVVRFAVCIAVAASLSACARPVERSPAPTASATAMASARVVQVATAPGVSIEVFDWGGSGRPLVFLGGGGHSARQFDEFAPPFATDYRVIAISRRGSGGSSDVPPDSLDVLVDDIVAVLDSMKLGPAVLVGHSFAGAEMALFGEKHGGRCAGLVYLDSAYDYTDPEVARVFETSYPPPPPPMLAADSASIAAVAAYGERTNGFRLPESEIRATRRFGPDGRMLASPPSETQKRMGALVRAPRWDAIQCPSLGLYPVVAPLETWLPWYPSLDAEGRAQGEKYVSAYGAWTAAQRAKFDESPRNRVVEFPGTGHYFFLSHPQQARQAILQFLSELS